MSTIEELCQRLRLPYVAKAAIGANNPDGIAYLKSMLETEVDKRNDAKLKRLEHRAEFPQNKTFNGYLFNQVTFPESCNQEQLLTLEFIRKQQNVLMLGAVGTGKTHLATALGVEACRQGFVVRFIRVADLVAELQKKHKEGHISQYRKELAKCDCLILDELGYVPFHESGGPELLFHVIADYYEKHSIIVTSNMEVGEWTSIFGDTNLTKALVDRLVHHAHILKFSGESFRLTHALSATQP